MSELLGVRLDEALPCEVVTTGLRHLIVPVADVASLSRLMPSRAAAEALGAQFEVDTIGVIAQPPETDAVRLRDLCAPIGELEEPASGTTAAAVADFVARHRARSELVVHQGDDMGRPSVLRTRTRSDRVVEVTGEARPILTGKLHG